MTQSYEEAVIKCVLWWSDKSFRTLLNQNNGDNTLNGGLAFVFMNTISSDIQNKISDDQIKKFESKLTELLLIADKYERILSVDYDPCRILYEACKFAEIDTGCLPIKSFTSIDNNNEVLAKHKYGGQTVKI